MNVGKKEQIYKFMVYVTFFFLILIIHFPWTYIGDDLMMAPGVENESLVEHFVIRYFSNGRICTDVLANAFYRIPMKIWKVFDAGIYVVIAMLISWLFTANTYKHVLSVCMLMLLFPFDYLGTAGYVCVTTNYVYTVLGILLILVPIKFVFKDRKIPIWGHLVSILSILYVTNHDQTAMVLIGGLFLYLIYIKVEKNDKKIMRIISAYLVMSICSYGFMFFMPGHINRMSSTAEMEVFLPEYADWTFLKKIYHGYTATVAHVMYNDVKLFCVFCVLLFLITLHKKSIRPKCIGALPMLAMVLVNVVGKDKFIHYNYQLPDLLVLSKSVWNIVPLLLSIIILICIVYTVCVTVKSRQNKLLLLLLLLLAAGSREMMGFSATLYASSYRTFTFFLYAIILCCLILLDEMSESVKDGLWCAGMVSIATMLVL